MSARTSTTVLVAHARRLVRDLVKVALVEVQELDVCASVASAEELLTEVCRLNPDVVLLGASGLHDDTDGLVAAVRSACPTCGIVMLLSEEDECQMLAAVGAGAMGFVTVDHGLKELVDRVRSAAANETVLPSALARRIISSAGAGAMKPLRANPAGKAANAGLTRREDEILSLLAEGMGNAEIARAVGLSANTVKNHLYSVYRKLGVESRGQAIVEATRRGLVTV